MIKFLIMDVDGTLTDGKIYMGSDGEAMKAFSVKDGYAINFILKPADITPVILTARKSVIVENRCRELGIREIHQGKTDKLAALKEVVGQKNLGSCAYFGDDILDLKCMLPVQEVGGIVGCPADAVREVRMIADYVCEHKAGEGALREFAEWITDPKTNNCEIKKRVDYALTYLKALKNVEPDGQEHVVNPDFFYSVQSYRTRSAKECKFESHRKYIDIQIMVKGMEAMDLADISRLSVKEEYDSTKDIMFWNDPERMAQITLKEGDFAILYPENAHRGAIALDEPEDVIKIVGKVNVL